MKVLATGFVQHCSMGHVDLPRLRGVRFLVGWDGCRSEESQLKTELIRRFGAFQVTGQVPPFRLELGMASVVFGEFESFRLQRQKQTLRQKEDSPDRVNTLK